MGGASTLLGNLVYLRACKLRPGTVLEWGLMMLHGSVRTKIWAYTENSCGNLKVLFTICGTSIDLTTLEVTWLIVMPSSCPGLHQQRYLPKHPSSHWRKMCRKRRSSESCSCWVIHFPSDDRNTRSCFVSKFRLKLDRTREKKLQGGLKLQHVDRVSHDGRSRSSPHMK